MGVWAFLLPLKISIMSWKKDNLTLKILRSAEEHKFGVMATVAYTFDHIIAMIKAAEIKQSPLIIQVFPWAILHSNGDLVRAAYSMAKKASVPIAIHLDHCQDPELVKMAAKELPFDSIMVDMSHYEKSENLEKTKELVSLCNKYFKATEAEPGRIEGGEDGISDTADLEGVLTTPDEASLFIDTGIDIISPAFGNFHGDYPPEGPQLRFEIIQRLQPVCADNGIRLCLHGTNDFTPDIIHQSIEAGMSKINVNKLVLDTHLKYFQTMSGQVSYTDLLDKSNDLLVERMCYWLDVFESTNKAHLIS